MPVRRDLGDDTRVVEGNRPTTVHAFRDDALGDHDGLALAGLIAAGEITAAEAAVAAIERARAVEDRIHGIAADCFEAAQAKVADGAGALPRGLFTGVPTLIKDMSNVEGMSTRWGSDTLRNAGPARANAPEVQQLIDMGMCVVAKTTLPEFGIICSAEYPDAPATRNPWNLDHTPGGSSSGSAALVAAGVVPLAHAADGGGSIRIPASACGLVGLKPSRGRIYEDAAGKLLPVRVTTHGVVSRTVRDSWAYLAEADRRYSNPRLPRVGSLGAPLDHRLRVGVIRESSTGAMIDQPTARVLDETITLLEALGHQVETIPNPVSSSMADDFILYYGLLCLLLTRGGKQLLDRSFDRNATTPVVQGFAEHCRKNLSRLPGVIRRLRGSSREFADLLGRSDVILTPTVGQLPPRIGHFDTNRSYTDLIGRLSEWACFTPWSNVTGVPAISLPMGHDAASNLPIGMMFHAALGHEQRLLELGLQLESAQPWRRIHQPVD